MNYQPNKYTPAKTEEEDPTVFCMLLSAIVFLITSLAWTAMIG